MIKYKKSILPLLICLCAILLLPVQATAAESYYDTNYSWTYTTINQVKITNSSDQDATKVVVTVPLMDSQMPAYQQFIGEQLNPWPNTINVSNTGSREAVYRIDLIKAGQTVVLEQRYVIENSSLTYTFSPSSVADTYTQEIPSQYLAAELKVESNNAEIIAYAKKIAGDETNPYRLAKKVFAEVNLYLTYDDDKQYANKGALAALRSGRGVCEDYTNLYIALLRSLGIPARQMTGYLYMPKEHNDAPYYNEKTGLINLSLLRHAWPEFYLPNIGWVVCDPTFTYIFNVGGEPTKFVDWDYFANIPSGNRLLFFREDGTFEDEIRLQNNGGKLNIAFASNLSFESNYSPFNDLEGHWAKYDILYLHQANDTLLAGVGNGLFAPDRVLTRAQLVVFLGRILDLPEGKKGFLDVPNSYWAASEILAAKAAGWINGYADGTFRPEEPVTRAEMATILKNAFKIASGDEKVTFSDIDVNGFRWAVDSINIMASNGLLKGVPGGGFMPQKTTTRAEFAVVLSRIIQKGL